MATQSYLDRFLEPITEAFTPEVAQKLVDVRADGELQARIDDLRRKANDGTLTVDEEADYKDFVEAVDVISIIQAKAHNSSQALDVAWMPRRANWFGCVPVIGANIVLPQTATPAIAFHVEHVIARRLQESRGGKLSTLNPITRGDHKRPCLSRVVQAPKQGECGDRY